jgi:hypothetical protein
VKVSELPGRSLSARAYPRRPAPRFGKAFVAAPDFRLQRQMAFLGHRNHRITLENAQDGA